MPNRVSRRRFLKLGALAATATVVSGCTVNLQRTEYLESYVRPPEEGLPGENVWYASACRQCAAGCGLLARLSDGRVRKVEGNPLHPVNRGKLCARGQAVLQELYDPDRLRHAVGQVGGRGSLQFQPLPWEAALQEVTTRLTGAAPEGVAFLGGNLPTHLELLAQRFLAALGAPPPLHFTLGDEMVGWRLLSEASQARLGSPALPLFDLAQADVVFSFGANFLETWLSPLHYSRAYSAMRRRDLGKRGYLVQFEPRLSATAACADEWVPLQPGSEALVARALGKLLAAQGVGAGSALASWFAEADVPAAAAASGVAVAELERLAAILARWPQAVILPGAALGREGAAPAALDAVLSLNVLLGRVGQPGGVYRTPSPGVAGFRALLPSPFAQVQELVGCIQTGQVQVLFIHGLNPVFELPYPELAEALAQVPYVVSFNSAVDETAAQADLLLPDHTNLESWGYHVPLLADRPTVSALQPVTRPLYDTRSTADVLLALADALGGEVKQALPWPNEVAFLQEQLAALGAGIWSGFRRQGGWWAEQPQPESPTPLTAAPAPPLALASASPDYPLSLLLYPSTTLFDGRGANKPWLQETPDPMTTVAWETWVEVHPHTADRLGLQDNDIVRVCSPAGEVEAVVYRFPGLAEGVAAMPLGQGHQGYGRYAKGHGANPARLLAPQVGQGGHLAWGAAVRLEPTGRRRPLPRLESPEGVNYMQSGSEP
ncbi:MAG: molybdopterin-dependent oxidoreductase [Chloroflexi bacterium]|nr:molybdopterin-dependent oxidoreductase [Chloroflexota bacterium]